MHNLLPETRDWVRQFMKRRTSDMWACRSPLNQRQVIVRSKRNACVRAIDAHMREAVTNRFRQRLFDEAAQQSSEDPRLSFRTFYRQPIRRPSQHHRASHWDLGY